MLSIYEIGNNVLVGMNKIDNLFEELKKDKPDYKQIMDKLSDQCNRIFNTKFVFSLIKKGPDSYNCAVLPIVDPNSTEMIIKEPDKVKLNNIEEVQIYLGANLIKLMEPKELTAILLHEVGHIVNTISKISHMINRALSILGGVSATYIVGILTNTLWLFPGFLVAAILNNKLNLQPREFKADKFAVEYGYGDELISVTKKFKILKMGDSDNDSYLKNLFKFIYIFFTNLLSTHPSEDKRIKSMMDEMLKNYYESYPNLKNAIPAMG